MPAATRRRSTRPGELAVPDGVTVLEGAADGGAAAHRSRIVVARFNGEITNRMLERALDELAEPGCRRRS